MWMSSQEREGGGRQGGRISRLVMENCEHLAFWGCRLSWKPVPPTSQRKKLRFWVTPWQGETKAPKLPKVLWGWKDGGGGGLTWPSRTAPSTSSLVLVSWRTAHSPGHLGPQSGGTCESTAEKQGLKWRHPPCRGWDHMPIDPTALGKKGSSQLQPVCPQESRVKGFPGEANTHPQI